MESSMFTVYGLVGGILVIQLVMVFAQARLFQIDDKLTKIIQLMEKGK